MLEYRTFGHGHYCDWRSSILPGTLPNISSELTLISSLLDIALRLSTNP